MSSLTTVRESNALTRDSTDPQRARRRAVMAAVQLVAVLAVVAVSGVIVWPGGAATPAQARQSPARPGTATGEAPAPRRAPQRASGATSSGRVVAPTQAAALFAQHSWYVPPPPVPPPPPPEAPPPPEPTAPPLPYAFLGTYAPAGDPPVFFIGRGDRVIDAHVGDQLDGVYRFESAGAGQLVFVYLPLNVRQTLAAPGVSR